MHFGSGRDYNNYARAGTAEGVAVCRNRVAARRQPMRLSWHDVTSKLRPSSRGILLEQSLAIAASIAKATKSNDCASLRAAAAIDMLGARRASAIFRR